MTTILIVDDEPSICQMLEQVLEVEGFDVVTASNGREGMVQADKTRPDLVILDFSMPVMNGSEMAKALRSAEGERHVKILMYTSYREQYVRAGCTEYDAFLSKPSSVEDLIAAVEGLLH